MPDNTDIRFVFVKLDDLLDKYALSDYISKYQNLKRAEKSKKRREDDQISKYYARREQRNGSTNLKNQDSDDFFLPLEDMGPKIKADQIETEESYERNKNNPEFYPSLNTKVGEEDKEFQSLSTTKKNLANAAVQKIFEMEEKKMQEKLRKLSEKEPVKDEEPTEEDIEREFQANAIVIIKKPGKKKKGRK